MTPDLAATTTATLPQNAQAATPSIRQSPRWTAGTAATTKGAAKNPNESGRAIIPRE
jgi:hypothetical protein